MVLEDNATANSDSLYAMMEHRYEAYKKLVVKPFFRDHFARIDRQIVLVDALQALNAGGGAVADLQDAHTAAAKRQQLVLNTGQDARRECAGTCAEVDHVISWVHGVCLGVEAGITAQRGRGPRRL